MGIRTSFSAMEAISEKRGQNFWPDPVMAKMKCAEKRYHSIWLSQTDKKIESLSRRIDRLMS